MVWNKVKKGLRATTTPLVYIMSGFDGEAADNYLRGSDNPDCTNGPRNSQNAENKLTSSDSLSEETLKRLEKVEKILGISQKDNIDKIAEIKKSREQEIKDLIEASKGASPEERKRIMDEIVTKTREEQEAINKILQEDNKKLEQKKLKTLEEANQAQQAGNQKKAAELFAQVSQQQQVIHQNNQAMEFLKKKLAEKEKAAKEYAKLQQENTPWYKDVNWGSWQVWLVVISALAFLYLIYRLLMWAYGKIASIFNS